MSKAWSKDVVLNPGTFGGTPACHIVVDMMNHDVISVFEKHRVLSFITYCTIAFKAVADIKHTGFRERFMFMMRDEFYKKIDTMPYPEKFNSFLKNVVNHHCRRNLKEAARTIAPQGEESRG